MADRLTIDPFGDVEMPGLALHRTYMKGLLDKLGVEYEVEGFRLEKTFIKKRSVKELVTRPFRRAERIRALRGVDLHVRRGEIFGLLGPNGADPSRSADSIPRAPDRVSAGGARTTPRVLARRSSAARRTRWGGDTIGPD